MVETKPNLQMAEDKIMMIIQMVWIQVTMVNFQKKLVNTLEWLVAVTEINNHLSRCKWLNVMKTLKIIKESDSASTEEILMKLTEFFPIWKRAIIKVYWIYKMKSLMVQTPFELSRIYVINLKERGLKMPIL